MTLDDLAPLFAASRATPEFRRATEAYLHREPTDRLVSNSGAPRVKVLRVVAQMLASSPELAVDALRVQAVSGCADFVGTAQVTDADGESHTFAFEWNCEWKARQLGYVDYFGLPDQIRAAQEFGWQCFARWERAEAMAQQHG